MAEEDAAKDDWLRANIIEIRFKSVLKRFYFRSNRTEANDKSE